MKIKLLLGICLLSSCCASYASRNEFDVESCQPGKPYVWTSHDAEDDAGIINSTTKNRHVTIHVNANSPSGILFDIPCENQGKELLPGKTIVCLLKPYYRGSGVGYIISWSTKGVAKVKPASGTVTVEFN